jgi:branched-subunit amino acid aminotransferase/4-amino-4-deoxychorismate lyase
VSHLRAPRVEINGSTATIEQIWGLDLSDRGHFTAVQVRDRAALGMDFHLARLDVATRELFGVGLGGDRVRGYLRQVFSDDIADASLRVNVFRSAKDDVDTSVVVSVRPPASAPAQAQRLLSVGYQRPMAHIKHANGFGQGYFAGLARANDFDEALFVAPGGFIAECATGNIGFIDGDALVWPDAPALRGIMMQVLQRELDGADLTLPTNAGLMRTATQLLAAAPYDPI